MDKLNEVKGIPSYQNKNRIKNSFQVQLPKEINMSTKVLLKTLLPLGLLALVFLAAQIVSSKSMAAPAGGDAVTGPGLVAPDMIELRSYSLKSNKLAYDDYFQRHASEYFAGSNNMAFDDYFQRHASEYTAGSNKIALDDYFQRHASDYSAGLDWIELQPSTATSTNYSAEDDYFQRHASDYSPEPVRWPQKPGHSFGTP